MAVGTQRPESDLFPPNTNGNGSKSREEGPPSVAKPIKTETRGRPSSRKSTGPRTAQGKERSKFNAFKDGLYSKVILLKDDSPAEYVSLLNGLRDDLKPEGTLEATLVENLAVSLWRKRRLFQAENAELSEKMGFTELESVAKQHVEVWDLSRATTASGGLLKYSLNPLVVRATKEILMMLHHAVTTGGLEGNCRFLKKLYGVD
jgi:hypothetical protein